MASSDGFDACGGSRGGRDEWTTAVVGVHTPTIVVGNSCVGQRHAMNDDDDDADAGGSSSDEVAQPSFNDKLNLVVGDFSVATSAAAAAAVAGTCCGSAAMVSTSSAVAPAAAADASPAAVSLHTPTPPDVDDVDEMTTFSFDLHATPSLSHYDLPCSPVVVAPSSEYDNDDRKCVNGMGRKGREVKRARVEIREELQW